MSNNAPTQIIFARSHNIRSTEWTKLFGGVGQDTAYDLEIDDDGSIYVVGVTQSSFDEQENAGHMDGFITKFDKDGEKIWTRMLGTYSRDNFQAVTIGNDGSVYVGGGTWGNIDDQTHSVPATWSNETYSRASDAFVVKYSPDGEKIWTRILIL